MRLVAFVEFRTRSIPQFLLCSSSFPVSLCYINVPIYQQMITLPLTCWWYCLLSFVCISALALCTPYMSWDQGDVPFLDADLDLFDFDLGTFEGYFPLDVRVEEISEVIAAIETKTDELSSLSSASASLPQSTTRTEPRQKPAKPTKPKKARKFVDLINEDSVLLEQEVLSQAVSEALELESKMTKITHSSVPRPVTTDLRRFYPRMFMNSINSGDLMNVQNYFNTFMTGPCKFIAKHHISTSFGMPQQMTAVGPQFFSHYLLGCFVTFPDMVLRLLDSHVITSPDWVGTKIVMDTEVNCTKIYDMAESDYAWVPEVDNLSDVYQQMSVHDPTASNDPTSTSSNGNSGAEHNDSANNKDNTPSSRQVATNNNVALTRIPMSYVEKLLAASTLMKVPEPLVTKGTITLYLDEHNCMQHVVVDLVQQNRPKR